MASKGSWALSSWYDNGLLLYGSVTVARLSLFLCSLRLYSSPRNIDNITCVCGGGGGGDDDDFVRQKMIL